jgi:peptide/nickel transport system substrate-binding protein
LSEKKIPRRRFIKYVGAGVVVVAAAGVGAYYYSKPTPTGTITTSSTITSPTATSPTTTIAPKESTLVVQHAYDTDTIDPAIGYTWGIQWISINVYENLVRTAPGMKDLQPGLAESWESSPDQQTWTFHLRKGVKFHDGTPFDANAVKVSIERLQKIGKGPSWIVSPFKQIDAVDPSTVQIKLSSVYAPFLPVMASTYGMAIVSPTAVKDYEKDNDLAQNWFHDHAVGTGPYMLQKADLSQEFDLVKNPDYWGGWEGEHVDRVLIKVIPEPATSRMMLTTAGGGLDVYPFISYADANALKNTPGIDILAMDSYKLMPAYLNTQKTPTDNKKVRQAISYATDYDRIINDIVLGYGKQLQGPMSRAWPYHDDTLFMYSKDLTKAKQLMKDAGHPNGVETPMIYMWLTGDTVNRQTGELLKENLADIGLTLNLEEVTDTAYFESVSSSANNAPHIATWEWEPTFPDPHDVLSGNYGSWSAGSGNCSWYKNPAMDDLLNKAAGTIDTKERAQLYSQIQKIIVEDAVALFLYEPQTIIAKRSTVKNYQYDAVIGTCFRFYPIYIQG